MIREGNLTSPAALGRPDLGLARQCAADDELLPGEVDVAPAQRHELSTAEASVRRHAHELRVLGVVMGTSGRFLITDGGTGRIPVGAGGKRLSERFNLHSE